MAKLCREASYNQITSTKHEWNSTNNINRHSDISTNLFGSGGSQKYLLLLGEEYLQAMAKFVSRINKI